MMFLLFPQVLKPLNQVLSSLIDQEAGQQIEHDNLSFDGSYSVDEFEVRILEPEKSGGPWQTRATIPMQSSENALTVRVVTLLVSLNFNCCFFIYNLGLFILVVVVLGAVGLKCLCSFRILIDSVVSEYNNKRERYSFGHWDCVCARGGCRCKRACALVFC